jgi:hypothetical protein
VDALRDSSVDRQPYLRRIAVWTTILLLALVLPSLWRSFEVDRPVGHGELREPCELPPAAAQMLLRYDASGSGGDGRLNAITLPDVDKDAVFDTLRRF